MKSEIGDVKELIRLLGKAVFLWSFWLIGFLVVTVPFVAPQDLRKAALKGIVGSYVEQFARENEEH